MKRRKIVIITITMIILTLLAVAAYIYFDKLHPKSCVIDNITLEVKKDTITKTGATFIITNKNNYSWSHSHKYVIQVKKFGLWINQPWIVDTYAVKASAPIEPIGTSEIKQDWSKLYGELGKGQYRYGIATELQGNEYIFAEFTIE